MLSPPHDLDYALSHTHAHAPGATDVLHMLTETPPHTHTRTKKRSPFTRCMRSVPCSACLYLRCLTHKDFFFTFSYMLSDAKLHFKAAAKLI